MRSLAFRLLIVGGLLSAMAAGAGCSSGDDDTSGGSGNQPGKGGSGAGATGGTGGAGGSSAGMGTGGTAATAGTGGSSAGTSSQAGTGGSAGTVAMGGMGGSVAGGSATGGMAGSVGMAGTASGGAPAGGMAGTLGSGGAAAGNGGGGMPATLVTPIKRSDSSYVLEFGNTYFEVNPMNGGRVVDVHLAGGMNLLGGMADNSGSVFWPSPQANWTWPPTDTASITNINDKPYTPSNDDTSMTMVGMAASSVGISVTKKYAADLAKEAVVVTYSMIGTASGKSVAPWEITRFPQTGVTFYPSSSEPFGTKDMSMDLPAVTKGAGCTWVSAPGTFADASSKDQKLFADGTDGWLAHADADWVIIKKFTDMQASQAATGEAEIEIYLKNFKAAGAVSYMEVEQQGPYGAIDMGQKIDWTVTWYVRKLPSGAMAMAGNQALVDFVKSVVQ